MRKLITIALMLSGCGYESRNSELMGQVKKVTQETPLLCFNHSEADISMGIMRNGVGSMSSEDIWVYVPSADDEKIIKQAAETGSLVKITYDVQRVTWCVPDHIVTKVELVK